MTIIDKINYYLNEVVTNDRTNSIEGLKKHIESLNKEKKNSNDPKKKADIDVKISAIKKDIQTILTSVKKDKESGKTGSTIK